MTVNVLTHMTGIDEGIDRLRMDYVNFYEAVKNDGRWSLKRKGVSDIINVAYMLLRQGIVYVPGVFETDTGIKFRFTIPSVMVFEDGTEVDSSALIEHAKRMIAQRFVIKICNSLQIGDYDDDSIVLEDSDLNGIVGVIYEDTYSKITFEYEVRPEKYVRTLESYTTLIDTFVKKCQEMR